MTGHANEPTLEPDGVVGHLVEHLTRLRDTHVGQRLRDWEFLRRHAAEALRDHADPMLREIGNYLRDGGRPAEVLRVPEYAVALGRAADTSALTASRRASCR